MRIKTIALRPIFGLLVRDPALRELVPSILARIQRCNRNDQQELELVFGPLLKAVVQQVKGAAKIFSKLDNSKISQALETSLRLTLGSRLATTGANSIDQLEYWLISYSELWAEPSPTEDDLMEFYKGGVFSVGSAQLEQYCLLSGNLNPSLSANSRDAACFQLNLDSEDTEPTNFTQKFTYGRDEYSNRSAPVPTNASLLIINGGLDFQTPWEFGRHQFEATKLQDPGSSKKMLVEFDFGAHVCGLSVTTAGDGTLCSPGVVASFISNSGDPNAVDTSCMAELPELELNDNAFSMLVESLMEEQRDQMLAGIDYGQ
ncbi:hypothetical protein ON010_g19115 [Phytophthora cinnamomi]|nr:hypothetical protein ON010_g19115 [Phytophthora cinnamomi]